MWALYDKRAKRFLNARAMRVPELFAREATANTRLEQLKRQVEAKDCVADDVVVKPVRLVPDDGIKIKVEIAGEVIPRERIEAMVAEINAQIGDHAKLTVHTADEA